MKNETYLCDCRRANVEQHGPEAPVKYVRPVHPFKNIVPRSITHVDTQWGWAKSWRASIYAKAKRIYLGSFETRESAEHAYIRAYRVHHLDKLKAYKVALGRYYRQCKVARDDFILVPVPSTDKETCNYCGHYVVVNVAPRYNVLGKNPHVNSDNQYRTEIETGAMYGLHVQRRDL